MKVQGLLIASILLLSGHIGHALECYSCDYGTCLIPSKTTCGLLQVCGTETSTTAGYINLKKRGCLNPTDCMSSSVTSYMGVRVEVTPSCCITNLCNSAAAPKVSVITAIATMLALVLAKLS